MNTALSMYAIYITISIAMTFWVARTLHRNGRIFLVDAFSGNEKLADSVNHLLVVGFYLINIGWVLLYLKYGVRPVQIIDGVEYTAAKLGTVMLILGASHFFNIYVFYRLRDRGMNPQNDGPKDVDFRTESGLPTL